MSVEKNKLRTSDVRTRQGGRQHADSHEKGRTEDPDWRQDRDRSSGNTGSSGSPGDHRTGGASGLSGGAVPANRGGELSSGTEHRSQRSGPARSDDEHDSTRLIQTTRFGTVEIPENHVIVMPVGIPGFGDANEFVLLDHRPGSIFRWLQSLTLPGLAFVVVDPLIVDEAYPLDSVRRGLGFLNLQENEDLIVLCICTVPGVPDPPTVNMMAPIGIGLDSRLAAQVVLHDTSYGARTEFLIPAA